MKTKVWNFFHSGDHDRLQITVSGQQDIFSHVLYQP
jgi:hypothetical protein